MLVDDEDDESEWVREREKFVNIDRIIWRCSAAAAVFESRLISKKQ